MKQFFYIIFLSFFSIQAFSQSCLPNGMDFNTQAQIDDFSKNYPLCKKIDGYVFIEGSDISNLNGLSQITSIKGDLTIKDNHGLTKLSGLDNLTYIGGNLSISDNDRLSSLTGLENLTQVNKSAVFIKNSVLPNFTGLNNLKSVRERLHVIDNVKLENMTGLENLESINSDFEIRHCVALKNITGLEKLNSIGGNLMIYWNPALKSIIGLNNLSIIRGDFHLSLNDNLINLDGLESLQIAMGNVEITACRKLESIESLRNLTSVPRHLAIQSTALSNLKGLENIQSVGGALLITLNDNLTNLDDLNSLTSIENFLNISGNKSLKNIEGLANLTYLRGHLLISDNKKLSSLSGLENLNFETVNDLDLYGNPRLSICNHLNICNYISNPDNRYYIENNAPGCTDTNDLLESCGAFSELNYRVFYDENQNQIKDENDFYLPNIPLKIDPIKQQILSKLSGTSNYFLVYGDYSATIQPTKDWNPTSNQTQNFSTSDNSQTADIKFGVYPSVIYSKLVSIITSEPSRCGEEIEFKVTVKNLGTSFESGTVWFDVDPRLTNFTADADTIAGDSIKSLGWHFENLRPGHEFVKIVKIQFPNAPEIIPGELLKFKTYFNRGGGGLGKPNNPQYVFDYCLEFRCSYDPNDKLVSPARQMQLPDAPAPVDYTLFEEDIFYTIRFQNTGNAEAYDVVIKDVLDKNLDPTTLRILGSSHYELLNTKIENDRHISFEFKDIFLPDSTTNFDASQGYVSYLIRAKKGLKENTPINNTAKIYFDSNPPIITNTTENIMVSELPTSSTENIDNQLVMNIFPNPTGGKVSISGENLTNAKITVFDFTGRILKMEKLTDSNDIFLSELATGVYFLKVETEEGTATKRVIKI